MSDLSVPIPLSDFSGGKSAQFNEIGDIHKGRVIDAQKRNQTDPATGKLQTFQSGDPKPMIVITLETESGETIQLYAKGGSNFVAAEGEGKSMMLAIFDAIRAAGEDKFEKGAQLAVQYTGRTKPQPGLNAAKLFKAQYVPPTKGAIPADLFGS